MYQKTSIKLVALIVFLNLTGFNVFYFSKIEVFFALWNIQKRKQKKAFIEIN